MFCGVNFNLIFSNENTWQLIMLIFNPLPNFSLPPLLQLGNILWKHLYFKLLCSVLIFNFLFFYFLVDHAVWGRDSPAACASAIQNREPPWLPYNTRASAIHNEFFKTLYYVFEKRFLEFLSMQWQKSFTEDYSDLIIVLISAFNAT